MSTNSKIETTKSDDKKTEIKTNSFNDYENMKILTLNCADQMKKSIDENHEIFWYNRISSIEKSAFSSLKNLKLIYLGNNAIKNINSNNFKENKHLKVLSLANNLIE